MIDTILEDRFQIQERLGRQGAVELFAGVDRRKGRPVWVKRWGAPANQDPEFAANWRAQLLSVRAIEDGHLPAILSFGTTLDGDFYQVEEPPPGSTLRRWVAAHTPMSVSQAVRVAAAAARAVGVAHREGVAHGSLSPETIWVEEGGEQPEAFVSGWEGGELLVALRNAGEALPERMARFLAPEQAGDVVPPATPATDVYALATILYEMLTGALPSPAPAGDEPSRRALAAPTPPSRFNPDVPAAVERVLLRALSRDPVERPANGQALANALMQALSAPGPAIAAPPPPPVVERTRTVITRRPAWLPVLVGLSLASFVLLALLLLRATRQPATALATATPLPAVPNLAGPPFLRYNEAVALAWNQGFTVAILGFRANDPNLPPGVVVAQCPPAGSPAGSAPTLCQRAGFPPPAADAILVEVSSLPEPVVMRVVPDLYGQSETSARAALEAGDLSIGTRRVAYDQLIPAGSIIEQNPRRGLAVLAGTPVDLIVSAGAPPLGEAVPAPPANPAPPIEPTPPLPSATPPPTLPPATPTAPRLPSPTATATPEPAGETVLLEDDFEAGNTLGWTETETEAEIARVNEGTFVVQLFEPGTFVASQPGRIFDDFRYEASVLLEEGTTDPESGVGLLFRAQDEQNFLFFETSGVGTFRLRARVDDAWQTLLDWQSSPAIQPPGTPNVLEVRAVGERLELFINGTQVVASFDLPPEANLANGDIGFGADAAAQPLTAQFDNVRVTLTR